MASRLLVDFSLGGGISVAVNVGVLDGYIGGGCLGCDWLVWRHLCGIGVKMPVNGLLFAAILPSLLSL